LVKTLGVRRALSVEAFVMLWSLYVATEGHDPERIEDLADAIGRDRATVFRWQSDFRHAFPQWSTPRDLLDYARVKRDRGINVRQVARLSLPS
jgi:hypothetical protein